jgi:hypothetical protein
VYSEREPFRRLLQGISQTTVATIIGKWWGAAEDDPMPMYSADLRNAIKSRIIGSIGSICLGSLFVDPCITLSRITTFSLLARPKLACVNHSKSSNNKSDIGGNENASSLPFCDIGISRTVNQWSFTYIGLYGYEFWEAGSKASQLFEARGWTHVVSDDLIITVMGMSSMIIGGSTALLGLIVEEVDGYYFTSSIQKPVATAFLYVWHFLAAMFFNKMIVSNILLLISRNVKDMLICWILPIERLPEHRRRVHKFNPRLLCCISRRVSCESSHAKRRNEECLETLLAPKAAVAVLLATLFIIFQLLR